VDTDVSEKHTVSIFRDEECRVRNWFNYIFSGCKEDGQSDPSERVRPVYRTISSRGSERPGSLEPVHTTEPIPDPTHLNSEDGSGIFLQNIRILLQDYTVPRPRKLNTEEPINYI
jgi:hypothetical protein